MQVCLDFERGWFLRINTRDRVRPCVAIAQANNSFLEHDSHIDGSLNEIDEFEIEQALLRDGVVGTVDLACASAVLTMLLEAKYINARDKVVLREIFAPFVS